MTTCAHICGTWSAARSMACWGLMEPMCYYLKLPLSPCVGCPGSCCGWSYLTCLCVVVTCWCGYVWNLIGYRSCGTVAVNKKLTFRFYFYDRGTVIKQERTVAERYGQKGDKRSHGGRKTFLVSAMHTKIAVVAYCAGFYDRQAAPLCQVFPLVGSQEDAFLFEAIARTTRSKRTWQLSRHKMTAFFRCVLR